MNKALKNLAMNARNRLMSRNASQTLKQKTAIYSPNVKFKIISNEDVEFNEKARSLSEEDMISPLKKLIDESVFSKLDAHAKERYLLETIDKYAKFRNKMERENSAKTAL